MSTPGLIGLVNDDETVRSIYSHQGDPREIGPILLAHYTETEKINTLLDLGDISVLGAEIGEKRPFDPALDFFWMSLDNALDIRHPERITLDDLTTHIRAVLTKSRSPSESAVELMANDLMQVINMARAGSWSPDWTIAYGRDRGDAGSGAQAYSDKDEFVKKTTGQPDYWYLFEGGEWWVGAHWRLPYTEMDFWMPLAEYLLALSNKYNPPRGGRKPESREEKRRVVIGWLKVQDKKDQGDYCHEEGISVATLRRWMRELEADGEL